MKRIFHIQNGAVTDNSTLSIRTGEKHFSYAFTGPNDELLELGFYTLSEWNEGELNKIIQSPGSLLQPVKQVQITYDNPQSVIMPSWCYLPGDTRHHLATTGNDLYGTHILSDSIAGWQLYNVYGIPRDVHDWFSQHFPRAVFRHQYSLGLKAIPALSGGCIMVDFRTEDFQVMVAKGTKFLLARDFIYHNPADVIYQLLRICKIYHLPQEEVQLRLSGLVEKQSALFHELQQYFLHIQFRESLWKTGEDFPSQFFVALNDLATCAS